VSHFIFTTVFLEGIYIS